MVVIQSTRLETSFTLVSANRDPRHAENVARDELGAGREGSSTRDYTIIFCLKFLIQCTRSEIAVLRAAVARRATWRRRRPGRRGPGRRRGRPGRRGGACGRRAGRRGSPAGRAGRRRRAAGSRPAPRPVVARSPRLHTTRTRRLNTRRARDRVIPTTLTATYLLSFSYPSAPRAVVLSGLGFEPASLGARSHHYTTARRRRESAFMDG